MMQKLIGIHGFNYPTWMFFSSMKYIQKYIQKLVFLFANKVLFISTSLPSCWLSFHINNKHSQYYDLIQKINSTNVFSNFQDFSTTFECKTLRFLYITSRLIDSSNKQDLHLQYTSNQVEMFVKKINIAWLHETKLTRSNRVKMLGQFIKHWNISIV